MKIVKEKIDLEAMQKAVVAAPWAAVDTEADSLHHYEEKLCLLQVSVPDEDYVVDPLEGADLSPLAHTLESKTLLFHGADFDIRLVRKSTRFNPTVIFDTLLAAQLLGYPKLALSDLAERHCGVVLSKKSQKADWSRRPLPEEMLLYAANDTRFLNPIRLKLERELEEKGRLEWHRQSCERLLRAILEAEPEEPDPRPVWQVKGSRDLDGHGLALLKILWYWRESEAKRRDRPRFKITHTEVLVEIARWAAKHRGHDVAEMPGSPRNIRGEYREALNHVLGDGAHHTPLRYVEKKPVHPRKKWGQAETEKLGRLKAERDRIGTELGIQPSLLATNAMLERLVTERVHDNTDLQRAASLMLWQADLVAESFLKVLAPSVGSGKRTHGHAP